MAETEAESQKTVAIEYAKAVDDERVRIEASPYDGEGIEYENEWEVKTKLRQPDKEEWKTVHTDYSRGKPEVSDVQ